MAEAVRRMPNVYKGSKINDEELAKFPVEGEMEMSEDTSPVDLASEIPLRRAPLGGQNVLLASIRRT